MAQSAPTLAWIGLSAMPVFWGLILVLFFWRRLESLFSLRSGEGNFLGVIIQISVFDWGHSELSLKLNCNFLLAIMAEKWPTKLMPGISEIIPTLRETSTLLLLCAQAQADYAVG